MGARRGGYGTARCLLVVRCEPVVVRGYWGSGSFGGEKGTSNGGVKDRHSRKVKKDSGRCP